jgi:hypothetical protein
MPAAASPDVTQDEWTPVAVDTTGKVLDEDLLAEFFADPVGTFNSLSEWPARLLIVRGTATPRLDANSTLRVGSVPHRRSDVLREFNAETVTAPDVEFAWKQTKAIASAANSTAPNLPNGPTRGY